MKKSCFLLIAGIRVSFVVSWPGKVKPGMFHSPAIQLDHTAMALAVAGVKVRREMQMDGVNLLPYLSGEKKVRLMKCSFGVWENRWSGTLVKPLW